MELAAAALNCLLPKLSSLLVNEYNLQKSVRGEIKFLQAELEFMKAALSDLSNRPADGISEVDKIWMRDLRELCYDIEDSVDAFMARLVNGDDSSSSNKQPRSSAAGNIFRRFIDKIGQIGKASLVEKAKTRRRISMDLEDIKTRVLEVAKRRRRYPVPDLIPNTAAVIDPRMIHLFENAANLVGIGGPAAKLASLLTQGGSRSKQKQKLLVASIVGVGGLGKTALANFVYQKLSGQFQCQAFVSVSLKPDIKKILSSILRQVGHGNCANAGEMDPQELIRSIRQFLNNKRYFIVIDDLWDESAWKIISSALIDNGHGSRVIVTTRKIDVGKLSSTDDIGGALYELQPLSDADSKRLFYKRVFGQEDGVDNELHEVAGKILKKCGGVPLAIITIASLLASKSKTSYEWYGVYKSIGSGLDTDKSMENMRAIISLSYYELPPHLKPCSLYLCIFPEDSNIDKDRLVRRWVAEGLVAEQHDGRNLYEVAEIYFNDLVNRSLIHPLLDSNNIDGKAETYRVHDMVLDFLVSVSTEDNFVSMSDCEDCQELIAPLRKIRRLSLQGSSKDKEILPETVDLSHVRSFIAFDDAFERMPPLSRFSAVRVLDLDGFPSRNNNHPKYLGRLHQLRYLRVGYGGHLGTDILEEIGSLKLLKTLDLNHASIRELPASIGQLTQLECLLVFSNWLKLPDWFGNLRSLQELSCLNDRSSPNTLAELGNLTQLRVLTMEGLEQSGVKTFLRSLSKLGNIQTIKFLREGLVSLDCLPGEWRVPARLQRISGGFLKFRQVPRWFSSLLQLSCLDIGVKELRQEDFRLIGALPMLRFLQLAVSSTSMIDELFVIGTDQPFPSLVGFEFRHWSRCWLVFAQGAMRELQRLHLYVDVHRTREGGLDIGLENLTSLEHVTVTVVGSDVSKEEVQDAVTKTRDAVGMHPNHPTFMMWSRCHTR